MIKLPLKFWLFSFFFIICLTVFWKFLLSPTLSFVDDGYSLTAGHSLLTNITPQNWSSILVEKNIGRFRPLYLLYFALEYLLFQTHPIGLWLGQALFTWITMILLYELVVFLTRKKLLGVTAALAWLMMPAVWENTLRAGTAEPRQMIFVLATILSFLYAQVKPQKWWLVLVALFTFLAIGTKETSILLLPFFALIWFSRQNFRFQFKPFLAIVGAGIVAVIILGTSFAAVHFFLKTGYAAQNFGTGIHSFLVRINQNRLTYAPYNFLLFLAGLSFVTRFLVAVSRQQLKHFWLENVVQVGFFVLLAQSIFFFLAWAFQFERYLYAPWTFLVILLCFELQQWIDHYFVQLDKMNRDHLVVIGLGAVLLTIFVQFVALRNRAFAFTIIAQNAVQLYRHTYDINQVENALISKLLQDKKTEVIYTVNDNYEVVYEMGLYLSQLKRRSVTVISPSKELAANEPGYGYTADPVSAYLLDPNPNKILIGRLKDTALLSPTLLAARQITQPVLLYKGISADEAWWTLSPSDQSKAVLRQK